MSKLPKDISDRVNTLQAKAQSRKTTPLWTGPEDNGPNGGITFSLLSRFLCCRERFRIHVIEGLRSTPIFNHRIEYGNMWHVCEEAYASEVRHFGEYVGTTLQDDNLIDYVQDLVSKYPYDQQQIDHWYRVCKVQFPLYVDYWSKHPDTVNRTPLLQEKVFNVSYDLPSGRSVRLRGKWDSVDYVTDEEGVNGIWLIENKTKGDIKELQIQRQLTIDLQVIMYAVALQKIQESIKGGQILS